MATIGASNVSSLDLDIDTQLIALESEWRRAYEDSISARAEYQTLAQEPTARAAVIDRAREKLDKTEAVKERIMAKIERLEERLLGND
jgi:hypothetical protein